MKNIIIISITIIIFFSDCKKEIKSDSPKTENPVTVSTSGRYTASSILQWQKCLGSSSDDFGNAVAKTSDGYFVAGNTTGLSGSNDAIVVKIDLNGNILWQTVTGGSGTDEAAGVISTPDGGCIVTGYTQSNDGDITGKGGGDVLLFKLSSSGAKEWVKTLGGIGYDRSFAIINTSDGAFALTGNTNSLDGDVTSSQVVNGNGKVWLVKFNISTGLPIIDWQKTIGITDAKDDVGYSLVQASNGSYTIAGRTLSSSNNADALILNVDVNGVNWSKTIASSGGDVAFGVAITNDYGYIVTGYYNVNNLLATKYNINGEFQWQKIFSGGGPGGNIQGRSVVSNSQGDIIVGQTDSKNGEIIASKGAKDLFVLRLDDSNGNKITSNVFGGKNSDIGRSVIPTDDGAFITVGSTNSNNGDVSGNLGLNDVWVVKFKF